MKKNIIFKILVMIFLLSLSLTKVLAAETINITTNSKIKYRWYTEEIVDGKYYLKGEDLEGYIEDPSNVILGYQSTWSNKNCSYSTDQYVMEKDDEKTYRAVVGTQYVKITNFKYNESNLKVFINLKELSFDIVDLSEDQIIIDLKQSYAADVIWFYVDSETPFDIYLALDQRFTSMALYKHIDNDKVLIPDESWIFDKTVYTTEHTQNNYKENAFRSIVGRKTLCRVREIQTYRYKANKVYYDNDYHEYVENYLKDYNDYIIEYTGSLPTNTINITKTVKEIVPIKEYIYIEPENTDNTDNTNNTEINSPTIQECPNEENEIIKTEYIENEVVKEVKTIPKKIYMIILFLILIIITESIIVCKKSRMK